MKALQTQIVIWAALVVSTLMLAGVSLFVPSPMGGSEGLPDVLPIALAAVSLSVAAVSFVLPKIQLKTIARDFAPEVTEEVDGAEVTLYRDQAPKIRVLRVTDTLLERLAKASAVPLITSLGMSESISINGLVLTRIGHSDLVAAPFLIAGTLLVAIRIPSKARLLKAVGGLLDAKVIEEVSS